MGIIKLVLLSSSTSTSSMADPEKSKHLGGGGEGSQQLVYMVEGYQQPLMEHWGAILYMSQNVVGGAGGPHRPVDPPLEMVTASLI